MQHKGQYQCSDYYKRKKDIEELLQLIHSIPIECEEKDKAITKMKKHFHEYYEHALDSVDKIIVDTTINK